MEENLREASANPHNAKAMTNMCWAQYMAAQAFSSGLLGILHSLSHAVCAYYDIHHGLNNGVGMARVWTYNQPASMDRYADIGRAMHDATPEMTSLQASDAAMTRWTPSRRAAQRPRRPVGRSPTMPPIEDPQSNSAIIRSVVEAQAAG